MNQQTVQNDQSEKNPDFFQRKQLSNTKTLRISKESKVVFVFVLTGLLGISSLSANAGKILFEDSFDKGNTEKWAPKHGRWIGLTDKEVYRQAIGGENRLGQSFIKKLIVNNFTITLKLRFLGGLPRKGFGAALRLRSDSHETGNESKVYIVGLGTGDIGGVTVTKKEIIKGKARQATLFHDEYPPIKFTKWYELKVRMKGAKITVWVNGKQVAELEDKDNPFLSGAVGISTYGAAIEVDNIIIEEE